MNRRIYKKSLPLVMKANFPNFLEAKKTCME